MSGTFAFKINEKIYLVESGSNNFTYLCVEMYREANTQERKILWKFIVSICLTRTSEYSEELKNFNLKYSSENPVDWSDVNNSLKLYSMKTCCGSIIRLNDDSLPTPANLPDFYTSLQ